MKLKSLALTTATIAVALLASACDRRAEAAAKPASPAPSAALSSNPDAQPPDPTDPITAMPERDPYQPETDAELRERLTDLQYEVTQNEGTERAFTGKYDKHYEEGIYVCIISGEPLFSSKDKYDSGCGWPAFTKPIDQGEIEERTDYKIGYARTEVRAKTGDSHLGHVFPDGPQDRGGMRYCINSASLRFVPKDKLVEEGYGKYLAMFEVESSK